MAFYGNNVYNKPCNSFRKGQTSVSYTHLEELLYRLFGVNAELLIDHAWGWEPCTMAEIKAYKPAANSIGSGQVLQCPYDSGKAKLVVREMTDLLVLNLVDKGLVTDQLVLTVGYDIENLTDPEIRKRYQGEIDVYKRQVRRVKMRGLSIPGRGGLRAFAPGDRISLS